MSHEIHEKDNLIYVGTRPWHGLGTPFTTPPTINEAINAAKLDWEVGLKPLFTKEGEEAPAFATFRKDDNAILGVVGLKYQPLQNTDTFKFFEPFLEAKEASIETCGSLKNGRKVWVLAKLNRRPIEIVKGDEIEKFILLSNSHDGTLAVRCGFTPIRVVCNNTLSMAMNNAGSNLIRIKHSKSAVDNLESLRETMNLANQQFETTANNYYKLLAKKSISAKDLETYIKTVLDIQKDSETGKFSTRATNIVDNLIKLFENGIGNNLPGIKGTYWAAYNSITDYLSHHRGNNLDNRYDSLWFGDSAQINKRALTVANLMAVAA